MGHLIFDQQIVIIPKIQTMFAYMLHFNCQKVVVLLLTALERKTHSLHEYGETLVQTDAVLCLFHKLSMLGI